MKKTFHDDFLKLLEKRMSPGAIARSRDNAKREVFRIRLADLRRQQGIRQKQIGSFSQSSLSKLEARSDMKISTLIDYLEAIGMGIQIKALPRGKSKNSSGLVLVET
jgi:hypothetical protein